MLFSHGLEENLGLEDWLCNLQTLVHKQCCPSDEMFFGRLEFIGNCWLMELLYDTGAVT